ncbi:MAG: thioredoxin [Clostridiales bacterium]|nr:thioredoxin [Clostridiales bacterium]
MAVTKITEDNFDNEVLNSDQPVLIDFWAAWCGPCQMLSPIVEEVAGEVDDVKVCKLNVDEEPELASRFGVMSIPTLVVMDQGKIVNQSVGYISKQEVLALIHRS